MRTDAVGLRLLVELAMRRDGYGSSMRWRRYTPAEIAAGVRSQGVEDDLDELVSVMSGLLGGERDEIPDHLVAPLIRK